MIKLGNITEQKVVRHEQVLPGQQTEQNSPHNKWINPINRNKGRMSLVVILDHSLIGSNIKCREK